ncbi:aldose 1-epimerase [Halobacillus karajensis]|uniref:Aldose 1-epimerase n=1 Tax=Halobacillus karajensis TaxID=195088 RepID=A0A024P7X5_9BACI|nr:aldose epimerase family protein [Halobacillus karajensis]CDQ20128.1 Aldose 1-epimerase precursor [Halobacillus karajensis]CDQ25209.1 Aldose 1-epimerase precursor [Halobacillus karajensis]CDQ28430.1 Aldose 1-epimerase precursor [Halobacillus karajensis]SEI00983.1 aldose 1-epimerase [Halobacillus karajensis]
MNRKTKEIQVPGQETWNLFQLENDQGMSVHFLNFGGIITNISVPDRKGDSKNVVLCYKNFAEYVENPGYLGALIGRVAGRIQRASFQLEGKEYRVEANEGEHHLHGGKKGFHQQLWNASPFEDDGEIGVTLSHKSFDGEGGYPGTIDVAVTYTLTHDNCLIIDYFAETDQTTVLTLTNHSYFNLSGQADTTVHDHTLRLNSSCFAELDEELIPTGEWINLNETPFNFRKQRLLGSSLSYETTQQRVANGGLDHFFLLDGEEKPDIRLEDETSGRTLEVETDQPGVVVYTSNNLPEGKALVEGKTRKHSGICIETQSSPASLHEEGFPEIVLSPDEPYHRRTVFKFGIGATQ